MYQKGFYLCRISFNLYIDEQILREYTYTYFTKKDVTCIVCFLLGRKLWQNLEIT